MMVAGYKIFEMDRRLTVIEDQAVNNLYVTTEAMKAMTDLKLLRDRVLLLEDASIAKPPPKSRHR